MAKKKKKLKAGTIRGMDVLKATRPRQDIPFRTGWHQIKEDRPRQNLKPRDIEEK